MSAALTARCLCGRVAYDYAGPADTLMVCHCTQCRQSSGSAFTPVVIARREAVRFADASAVTEYESSPGKRRAFCAGCGAPVYSRRDDLPDVLRLRAGLIADLPEPARIERAFRDEAWPWLARIAERDAA